MDIKDIADLSKVIDMCRKKGIETLKVTQDTVEFTLKDIPTTKRRRGVKGPEEIKEDRPRTDEEILFWSSDLPQINEGSN